MDCKTIKKLGLADEYLAGRLSEEARDAFERHLFECDDCFADLKAMQLIAEELQGEGAVIFEREIEVEAAMRRARKDSRRRTRFSPPAFRGLLAAGLALAVFAAVFVTIDRGADRRDSIRALIDPLAYSYLPAELRGGPGTDEFERGMGHYVQGEYSKAAALLEESARALPEDADVLFYLGVSLLMTGEYKSAESALAGAVEHSPSSRLFRWYRAQALLGCGELREAEDLLRTLAEDRAAYSTEAQALLDAISEGDLY